MRALAEAREALKVLGTGELRNEQLNREASNDLRMSIWTAIRCAVDGGHGIDVATDDVLAIIDRALTKQAQEQSAGECSQCGFSSAGPNPPPYGCDCVKPACEFERVAKPFELDAVEHDAMHGQIEQNGPYTRVGVVARALLRATKTLGPTELKKELERMAKLEHALLTIERSGAPGGSIMARRTDDHSCGWCRGMWTPCPAETARRALTKE